MEQKLKGIDPLPEVIRDKINTLFSPDNGYFGRIDTWGQTNKKYSNVGCVASEDPLEFLSKLEPKQLKNLTRKLTFFEMHMMPLKKMLESESPHGLELWMTETAWSHFSIVIMFGLLEAAVKTIDDVKDFDSGLRDKGDRQKNFLTKHIDEGRQLDIARRYKPMKDEKKQLGGFSEVIEDLWKEYRSGFIHDVGVHAVPLEPTSLTDAGTKDGIPIIAFVQDVPVYEWLIITWQAIFTAYGYMGKLDSKASMLSKVR